MSSYNQNPSLEQMYRDLESRVKTLETAPRLPASSIGSGGLRVKDGGNIVVEGGGNISVLEGGAVESYSNSGQAFVRLKDGKITLRLNDGEYPGSIFAGTGSSGRTVMWFYPPTGTGEDTTYLILEGPSMDTPGNVYLNSGGQLSLNAPTGDIFLTPGPENYVVIGHATTSNAANTHLFTNGVIQRSTSSLKYKRDVELAELSIEDILKLTPKTWRDKRQVEENPETTQRYIGFIAEDLHEAGLGCFVVYEDGEPDAIAYDRLAAALIVVIKSHEERLKTLEEKLNDGTVSTG